MRGNMTPIKRLMALTGLVALGAVLVIAPLNVADARMGSGIGSRGARTFAPPPSTPTAPGVAKPITRSTTAPSTTAPSAPTAAPGVTPPRPGGLFGGGFGGSLVRGLVIGGLFGLLLGHGFGGGAGLLGLLLQGALIAGLAMLAFRLFANRRQPLPAGMPAPLARSDISASSSQVAGPAGAGARADQVRSRDTVGLTGPDFDTFEHLLTDIQDAYSREDLNALRASTTPEVFGYLSEELKDNAARGLRNQVSEVKLLQGDLSEAWREGQMDYATVAMRYVMRDRMVIRATGAPAPGSPEGLVETTQVWTFIRPRGGAWTLSAIQDT